jgi:hypothetical protein
VIVPDGDVTKWLGNTDVRPEILAMIQKTLHQRGKTWIFSDKALVLRMAQTDDERLAIRKALSRTATLIAKLKLTGADAGKLADYWSAGRRFKDIEPFLDSMIATNGADKIDLIHLLPASVRKLLYTFPNESHGLAGYYPDCHWTSLNFFNYDPLQRLAEPPLATAYTIENYVQVPKAEKLGDVIFLTDKEKGNAYHSCVFVADDIVYTKNGRSRLSPWVLMKLEDVEELYGIYQQTVAVAYRLKSRMEPPFSCFLFRFLFLLPPVASGRQEGNRTRESRRLRGSEPRETHCPALGAYTGSVVPGIGRGYTPSGPGFTGGSSLKELMIGAIMRSFLIASSQRISLPEYAAMRPMITLIVESAPRSASL